MTDPIFSLPRLVELYDVFDGDRADLDLYVRLLDRHHVHSVLDVGCGTGTFADLIPSRGLDVTAVDPAMESVRVARRKPHADRVRWIVGEVHDALPLQVDAVTMTGNVAQVFLTDQSWSSVLAGVHDALRPGGVFLFEARRPEARAWERWNRPSSLITLDVTDEGPVTAWVEVTQRSADLVTFRWTYNFSRDGAALTSDSTLRFRSRTELEHTLREAGFILTDVVDAPDPAGEEWVFIAARPPAPST